MRVAVVGGGAVGLTAAADLAERDADVVLYDRGEPGSGSTGRAAGLCYDAFAEDVDAAIGAEAMARFRDLGVLTEWPYVWLAHEGDDASAEAVREQVPRMRAHGRDVALVDPAELGERYPDLRTDDVTVAAVARAAGYADPDAYVDVTTERLREAGGTVRANAPVSLADETTVAAPDGEAAFDAVLVAAGPATAPLVADVGASLALKTYRAQALVTEPLETTLPTYYDATEHVYWRPHGDGLLVGDGVAEADPDDWDPDADEAFVESALARVRRTTELDPRADRAWAGLCTATPDRDPLMGRVADGLYVATGWQGHGFMRAPATGKLIAEQVLGGDGVEPFDPRRFDGDEEFAVVEGMTDRTS